MRCTALWLSLVAAACTSPATETVAPRGPATSPKLEGVRVVGERLDTTQRLPAELSAYEAVALYPRASGFVDEVLVDRGSRVKKGQLLARLSAPELTAQRAEAESRLLATRSTFERTSAAAETPGAVARHDLEVGEATVKAEEARLRALKTLEDYLLVRAPFDGVVTERNVHPGALVGPPTGGGSGPMLRLESVGQLRLTVAVPEADLAGIAEGAPAQFEVRTWPGRRFTGVIRRVAHSVDPRTRTMPVELDVENAENQLAPGMFAEVAWPVRRAAESLVVPVSAIVQTPDKTSVDRVREGVLEQVAVQRGTRSGDRVEVFGALQAGDVVLRRGSEELKSGAKVQVEVVAADGGPG